jgi:membrane-bound metal-dependent hydrolase YbcI (DUF457 family)
MLPDLDAIPAVFNYPLFIQLHHELFHAPIYGVMLGIISAFVFEYFWKMKKLPVFSITALSFSLHGVVDVFFTNWYVKLLWPISSIKFSYPVLVGYNFLLAVVVYSLAVVQLWSSDLLKTLDNIS